MKKNIPVIMLLFLFVLALSACGLLQAPEEASAPIEAIPLQTDSTETVVATEEPEAIATEVVDAAETEMEPEVVEAPAGELRIYQITPGESTVRFELDEDLRGTRITVVGTTDQVAGELAINLADLATAQVGVMQINARTLLTDNDFRNRAIQNRILETGAYEFITFTPTAVSGLPASAGVGDQVTFTIEGELTIRDITQPATFTVVTTAVSETQLTGTASTTIMRADYDLNIPSVQNVANVEEEVELYIDFVANGS